MGSAAGATITLSGCDEVSLVSDRKVEEMGLVAWQEITQQTPESRSADLRQVTTEIADRLLRAGGEAPQDWEVRVFASPQVNAFALPGRKIGIYEGMFNVARSRDQVAAIIGHEIGHLEADHAQKRISAQIAKDQGLRLLSWALQASEIEFAADIAGALGVGLDLGLVLPYSRRQEVEADRFGVILMAEAGYVPEEAITLWQNMQTAAGQRGPDFLATHPNPYARIEEIRELLPQLN
jgi:predicted Zn-dependent protease